MYSTTIHSTTIHRDYCTVQHTIHYSTLQYTAVHYSTTVQYYSGVPLYKMFLVLDTLTLKHVLGDGLQL